MTVPTLGYQVRTLVAILGRPLYQIETVVTNRGGLPDPNAFLLRINDRADADRDSLERVCTPADLTDYSSDRILAIQQGQLLYRTSAAFARYNTFDTARAAYALINEQVSKLAIDYALYKDDFSTALFPLARKPYSWPLAAQDVVEQAKTAYCAARDLRKAQDAAIALQTTSLAALNARLSELIADLTALQQLRSSQSLVLSTLTSVQTQQALVLDSALAYADLVDQGLTLYTPPNPADALFGPGGDVPLAQDVTVTSLQAARVALEGLSAVQLGAAAAVAALDVAISSKESVRQQVQTDRDEAATSLQQLQTVLTSLQQAEAARLDALLQLDPAFDPDADCCC